MIIKLFGILDILSGMMLILSHFDMVSWRISIGFAMYLFIKAYMFKGDFASMVDFVVGVYFLMIMVFNIHLFLVYIFALYLFQKGFFSLH